MHILDKAKVLQADLTYIIRSIDFPSALPDVVGQVWNTGYVKDHYIFVIDPSNHYYVNNVTPWNLVNYFLHYCNSYYFRNIYREDRAS